jgi:hypothetical protein
MLLVQGLFIIRAAGRDPVHPATIGIVLGLASVLAGVAAWSLRRSNRRHNRPRLGGLWSAKTAEEPS